MPSLTAPPPQPHQMSGIKHDTPPLPATKFVSVLPLRDKSGIVDVEVVTMTKKHTTWWHKNVQPLVKQHYRSSEEQRPEHLDREVRADFSWNWNGLLWLTTAHNLSHPSSRKYPALGMTLLAVDKIGQRIPVGMLTVVPSYLCNTERWTRKGYVWFLSGAPDELYKSFLGRPLSGVGKALIDSAVVMAMNAKGDGSILLHASPRGGDDLVGYYQKQLGFQKLSPRATILSPCRWKNRTEFMHLPADLAKELLRSNKVYRIKK